MVIQWEAEASFCLLLLSSGFLLPGLSSAGRSGRCKNSSSSRFASNHSTPTYCSREAELSGTIEEVSTVICSTRMLPWRQRTVLDGLTLGNVPLSHLGSKVTATVRTLNIVGIFRRQDGRQVCGVSTFGNYPLDLSSLAEGADERFMLLSPVALPWSFSL